MQDEIQREIDGKYKKERRIYETWQKNKKKLTCK